jgi:hypothetical protein
LCYSLDSRIKLLKRQEKQTREATKATTIGRGGSVKKTKAELEQEKRAEEEKQRKEGEKVRFGFVS